MKPPLEEICCLRCIATGQYLCKDSTFAVRNPDYSNPILYGSYSYLCEVLSNIYDWKNKCKFNIKDFEVITYFERSYAREMYQPEPIKPNGIFDL